MSGLFGRVFQYLVNEVAVKQLAESRSFQQFAMRTHLHVEKAKTAASKSVQDMHNTMSKAQSGMTEFGAALREEVSKDFKKFK